MLTGDNMKSAENVGRKNKYRWSKSRITSKR